MDKNNHKLKILYKCIKAIPVPYSSICCTYHQLKYSSPDHSKKKGQERHKTAYLSENGSFGGNEVRRMGQIRKGYDRKSNRTRQKNKRGYIEKWYLKLTALRFQTGGRHQKSPGLPSGLLIMQ